jgi:hypothetical protein
VFLEERTTGRAIAFAINGGLVRGCKSGISSFQRYFPAGSLTVWQFLSENKKYYFPGKIETKL